jgi:hypothetical protein
MDTPIAAIQLLAANYISKYNANCCGSGSRSNENSSFLHQKIHPFKHAQSVVAVGLQKYSGNLSKATDDRRMD